MENQTAGLELEALPATDLGLAVLAGTRSVASSNEDYWTLMIFPSDGTPLRLRMNSM
jgi:hypothetical protein